VSGRFPARILCGVDFSERSSDAIKLAALIANGAAAGLTCVHARPAEAPAYFTGSAVSELERQRRDALVKDHGAVRAFADRAAVGAGADVRVGEGEPAAVILDAAAETGADLIVVGTRGRSGIGRLWLGSVAEAVVKQASVPVLVAPSAPKSGPVVCAVRDSDVSRTVLNRSALLAKALGEELVVMDSVESGQPVRTVEDLCARASAEFGCNVRYVRKAGLSSSEFVKQLKEIGAGLVVAGFERSRMWDGSSISGALRHAPAPVLLIPKEYANELTASGDIRQVAG